MPLGIMATKIIHMERTLLKLLVCGSCMHVEGLLRRGRGLPVLQPTRKVLLLDLQRPVHAPRAGPMQDHGRLPMAVIQPYSLVIFTIYISAVKEGEGAFRTPSCWTCIRMILVGLS